MAKRLVLEGFVVRPIAHAVDLDESSIEAVGLGEQQVKLADLASFATNQWPMMWDSLRQQFDDQAAAELAAAEAAKPRPERRRAARAKATTKKAASKKVVPIKKAVEA